MLSEDLGRTREEVVGLLRRMRKERRGVAARNVLGSPKGRRMEEIFKALGQMTWEFFFQAGLPLLHLPEDLKEVLQAGAPGRGEGQALP